MSSLKSITHIKQRQVYRLQASKSEIVWKVMKRLNFFPGINLLGKNDQRSLNKLIPWLFAAIILESIRDSKM